MALIKKEARQQEKELMNEREPKKTNILEKPK